jgi:hypothetical protein
MTTIALYNHTVSKFADGTFGQADTYKLVLLNQASVTAFDPADATLTAVLSGETEVSGNGWTAGGVTLTSVEIVLKDTDDAMFNAANIDSITATGGAIGPAYGGVIINSTEADSPPVALIDFEGAKTADLGTNFNVTWHADGIVEFVYNAA